MIVSNFFNLSFTLPLCEMGTLRRYWPPSLQYSFVTHADGDLIILEVCDLGATKRITTAPWTKVEPARASEAGVSSFSMSGSWRGQQCVHRVTCSGKLCKRKILMFA